MRCHTIFDSRSTRSATSLVRDLAWRIPVQAANIAARPAPAEATAARAVAAAWLRDGVPVSVAATSVTTEASLPFHPCCIAVRLVIRRTATRISGFCRGHEERVSEEGTPLHVHQ